MMAKILINNPLCKHFTGGGKFYNHSKMHKFHLYNNGWAQKKLCPMPKHRAESYMLL